ncbi:hypothetical protein V5O48_016484, partial [Marasmius crinis-equi]
DDFSFFPSSQLDPTVDSCQHFGAKPQTYPLESELPATETRLLIDAPIESSEAFMWDEASEGSLDEFSRQYMCDNELEWFTAHQEVYNTGDGNFQQITGHEDCEFGLIGSDLVWTQSAFAS